MLGRKRQAGFTAVEVVVVMMVVGVAMLASVPAFSRFMQTNGLKGSAEQMAGHMKLARQQAVSEGVPYLVVFNQQANTYAIVRDSNGNGVPNSGEPVRGPIALPNNINMSNPSSGGFAASAVQLRPDGTASQSGNLVFNNKRGNAYRLTLLGPTATVQIAKLETSEGQTGGPTTGGEATQ